MGSVAKYIGEAFGKQRALDALKAGGWKVGPGPRAAGAPRGAPRSAGFPLTGAGS